MIPEQYAKIFREGQTLSPDTVNSMKDFLRKNKPLLLMMITDKLINNYNNASIEERKKMGEYVLKYL